MTTFVVKYHRYVDGVRTYFTKEVEFKWYEHISQRRIVTKFFKYIDDMHITDVAYSDIDSISLVIDYINR